MTGDGAERLIDERLALRAAGLVTPGRREDPAVVARLREQVAREVAAADAAAREWTGLGRDLPPTTVSVVSRSGWVRANLAGLRGVFDPLAERVKARAMARQVLSAEIGALLGLLSTKVLGQYVLPLGGAGQGQLIVVGPNVLAFAERAPEVADDVRRALLLHELTHRLQFDGVDWLGAHLRGLLSRYLAGTRLDAGALIQAAARLPEGLRAAREEGSLAPLLRAVLTDEQREIVDDAQALMSLVEGHASAAMYADTGFVRDPQGVRDAVDQRRSDVVSRVLTAVAGLELKRRQYREGEAFVAHVVARVGTAGLNRAFAAADALPTPAEIADPDAWLARVHGHSAAAT